MVDAQAQTQPRDREPSLYDRVFNEPTVNPPELDVFRLNNARTELSDPDLPISEHIAEISVALGVGADDLVLLLAEELPDDELNLANLTRLYKACDIGEGAEDHCPRLCRAPCSRGDRPVRRSRPRPRVSPSERGWSANQDLICRHSTIYCATASLLRRR